MLDTGLPFNDNCEDVIVGGNGSGPDCRPIVISSPSVTV